MKISKESGSDSDSDSEPLKPRTRGRKSMMMMRQRSGKRSSNLNSFSPHASRQKRFRSSPTVRKQLGESLKKKPRLAVTCGNKEGTLYKDKFKKSEPCIWSNHKWFTPTEFEKFGGKEKNKKWKISILHNQIPLQTFIQEGFLPCPSFKTKRSRDKEPKCRRELIRTRRSTRYGRNSHTSESDIISELSSLPSCSTDDDEDDVQVTEREFSGDSFDVTCSKGREVLSKGTDSHTSESDIISELSSLPSCSTDDDEDDVQVTEGEFSGDSFDVTCSKGRGVLHVTRFATETCGKCIRTQDAWLTPEDFLNKNKPGGNWRLDIRSHSVPLGKLIMRRVLKPHMLNCKCPICTGEPLHLLDQNNDDMCFMCNRDGDLVCCDKCPRAFHHHCHKPALRDDTIGDHWTCSFCKKSVPGARKKSS
ncbi:nuclear body protein SP140-like protein isoform X1 [Pangasianodon hypophthalmus]|uniref:nuclear body protein SP140-like protein isoform X1 n=1 Tax=Pangasianodon hypophthalmus TaxID=310915 RepID=UPI000EFFD05E|nr:nuclear body protein SP140-like protein isoform X1 [Pangasianodon hypophthalmus]